MHGLDCDFNLQPVLTFSSEINRKIKSSLKDEAKERQKLLNMHGHLDFMEL